jgi:hypothetical protein
VKLARFRKPKVTCFLLYVEYRPNTSNIIYKVYVMYTVLYIHYIYLHSIYLKVGLVEETREEEKREQKMANNNEIHHICVGPRHKETR